MNKVINVDNTSEGKIYYKIKDGNGYYKETKYFGMFDVEWNLRQKDITLLTKITPFVNNVQIVGQGLDFYAYDISSRISEINGKEIALIFEVITKNGVMFKVFYKVKI